MQDWTHLLEGIGNLVSVGCVDVFRSPSGQSAGAHHAGRRAAVDGRIRVQMTGSWVVCLTCTLRVICPTPISGSL